MSVSDKIKSIAILMATFNGSLYLKDQISSIVDQDYPHWRLYIRDDGSSDNTVELIKDFVENDDRIVLINDDHGNLGAAHNFGMLLEHVLDSGEKYICFADQDDVWSSDKMSTLLMEIEAVEESSGNSPALVYSDLCVTDESLMTLHSSFMKYQQLSHEEEDPLRVLLIQNFITGCALMINRSLLKMTLPIPKEGLMHDWWFALYAAACGNIAYIDKPLVKYRQHESNEVGAKSFKNYLNPFKTSWMARWFEGRDNLFQSMKQAQTLAERIREHDPDNLHLDLVESYASLQFMSPLKRIKRLRDLGIHAQSSPRQALLLSRLLLTAKAHHA